MIGVCYQALAEDKLSLACQLAHRLESFLPEQPELLQLLGRIYARQGIEAAQHAIGYLSRALAHGRRDPELLLDLAQAQLELGQPEAAQATLAQAGAELSQEDQARIACLRGQICLAQSDWEAAETIYRELALNPAWRDRACAWLGLAAASQGDWQAARAHFAQANPEDPALSKPERDAFARYRKGIDANLVPSDWPRKILTLRHPVKKPEFYQVFLNWVKVNYPRYSGLFELRLLPCGLAHSADYRADYLLCLPWLQDPVQSWSPLAFAQTRALEDQFRAAGLPVLNSVADLSNASKLEGSRRMAAAGLPMPRMVEVGDWDAFRQDLAGLKLPLLLRDNAGHGGTILRFETRAGLDGVSLDDFRQPVAAEIVEVKSSDGLYRKYRYYAVGPYGISHHIFANTHWVTRGRNRVFNAQTRAEELAYISGPDPHHAAFQRAREALGLDFVAFDYGYTPAGELIVWEANPYPYIRWPRPKGQSEYRSAALHRTLAAMLLLYLERAGLEPLPELRAIACYQPEGEAALARLQRPA